MGLLCALAPNMPMLIVARGLQGLGGGGILPIVQTVISDIITPRERGQYQAYFSGVWTAAGIGGPIIGGVFAEHLHWSMIFWINVPLGIGSLALLLPKMGKIPTFHRRRKVDWLGGVLLMASAVVFMLVPDLGRHPLSVAVAGDHRDDRRGLCAGAGLCLARAAVSTGGAAIAGKAMARMKHYKRVAIIGTAFSALVAGLLAVATPLPLWALLVALSLFAFGLGTTFPISVVSIQNSVHRSQVGTVTGALNFFRALAASFTVAAFTAILLMSLGADISLGGEARGTVNSIAAADMVVAFRYVLAAAAALMASATLLMVLMEEKPLAGPATVPTEMAE
jgi:MFS family permease